MQELNAPWNVLRRSEEWVLGPGAAYEVSGDVPNVVFPCGLDYLLACPAG